MLCFVVEQPYEAKCELQEGQSSRLQVFFSLPHQQEF